MNNQFNEKVYSKEMPTTNVDKTRIGFILENIPDNHLNILDLGCWDGSYAARYKKKTNIVYGVESSVSSAKRAAEKGIIVEQGNFMEKDFFSDTLFDIIVAGEIIEHVFDTDFFVQKIYKMLKPGGKLILTTPNLASLPRRILLLLGKSPVIDNRTIGESVGHIRYFTFDGIDEILKDNHFKVQLSQSDVLNFNNQGTLYSTLIPRLNKRLGKTIMVVAIKEGQAKKKPVKEPALVEKA